MAFIANTFTTYGSVGNREDLTDAIFNIAPEDTPFMSNIGRGKAKATFHEWQNDDLAAPSSTNAQLEGFDVQAFSAVTPTVRIGNYVQISSKDLILADTQEVIDKAGRKSELAYQMAKRSAEIKRDMETILLENQAADAGTVGATPRKTGSLLAFIKTNVNKEATGVDPVYTNIPNDARTDSAAPRAFAESQLTDVLTQCWTEGANPKLVMVGAFNKKAASAFTGIATKTFQMTTAKVAAIIGAADVYVSDFGTVSIIANRFQRARDAFVLDPSFMSLIFLRRFRTKTLAETGDNHKRLLLAEWGLKVNNEKSQGLIADLTAA